MKLALIQVLQLQGGAVGVGARVAGNDAGVVLAADGPRPRLRIPPDRAPLGVLPATGERLLQYLVP